MEQQGSVVTSPARISLEDFVETVTRAVLRALEAQEGRPSTGGTQVESLTSTASPQASITGSRIIIGLIAEPQVSTAQ